VADQRAWPIGEGRGEHLPLRWHQYVSDRVNAAMKAMELPASDAALDLVGAVAKLDQLPVSDYGVLPADKIRECLVT
jgi:hypothetical protein